VLLNPRRQLIDTPASVNPSGNNVILNVWRFEHSGNIAMRINDVAYLGWEIRPTVVVYSFSWNQAEQPSALFLDSADTDVLSHVRFGNYHRLHGMRCSTGMSKPCDKASATSER
jgi:predicted carbohydrate-binding protein with CBM5 and CBM33 domain